MDHVLAQANGGDDGQETFLHDQILTVAMGVDDTARMKPPAPDGRSMLDGEPATKEWYRAQ